MKPSELSTKLAEALSSWLNSQEMDSRIVSSQQLKLFLVNWLLDHDTTLIRHSREELRN